MTPAGLTAADLARIYSTLAIAIPLLLGAVLLGIAWVRAVSGRSRRLPNGNRSWRRW